jgi:hypothetical protein
VSSIACPEAIVGFSTTVETTFTCAPCLQAVLEAVHDTLAHYFQISRGVPSTSPLHCHVVWSEI